MCLLFRFRAGGMALYPLARGCRAPRRIMPELGGCGFLFGEFCLAASFCPDRLAAPAACGIAATGSAAPTARSQHRGEWEA